MADEHRRTALVTGAAGAIGSAIARRLADDGLIGVLTDLATRPELAVIAEETGAVAVPADLADPADTASMLRSAREQAGPISVLVANAAYYSMQPFMDRDEMVWWRELETNLAGTVELVRGALADLREAQDARVIIISSYWGVVGWPHASGYAASKAGLISLTRSLHAELGKDGVGVSCVLPGLIDTPALEDEARDAGITLEQLHDRYRADIPMARVGRPNDVATVVSDLAGPAGEALSGQAISVSGGLLRAEM